MGPDEININQLFPRPKSKTSNIKKVIRETNPTMEGEATAMYIAKNIKSQISNLKSPIKITRIGRGLPVGADLEYADDITLQRAMEGRSDY